MNDATSANTPALAAAPSPAAPASPVANTPAAAAVSTVTPGWHTTEFWMTALGQLGLLLGAASGALPARYAVLAGAVGQAAYNVSRGMAKSNAAAAAPVGAAAA